MSNKKQTFTKPEVDVIRFEKNDVIATSSASGTGQQINYSGEEEEP